jgi:hypothetical protein
VDNLNVWVVPGGYKQPTMHFGNLLKALYESRGYTQGTLADSSGVSETSIQRGVAAEKCPWRRSAAVDVLRALERRAPLSEGDLAAYLQLAGLEALARMGADAMRVLQAERATTLKVASTSTFAYSTKNDPKHTLAHTWLQRILESGDEDRVLDSLRLVASTLGVELPATTDRRMVWVHHDIVDMGDGHQAHMMTPIHPAAGPPAKATPKRRAGA